MFHSASSRIIAQPPPLPSALSQRATLPFSPELAKQPVLRLGKLPEGVRLSADFHVSFLEYGLRLQGTVFFGSLALVLIEHRELNSVFQLLFEEPKSRKLVILTVSAATIPVYFTASTDIPTPREITALVNHHNRYVYV